MSTVSKGIGLVTGSAGGIGRSIALRLARDGFDLALNDVSSKHEQLQAVADDINTMGRRTHLVPADVTSEREVKGMVQDAVQSLGGLDVMVANAGIGSFSYLVSTDLDDWERTMAVNLRGVFLCYKHAATHMIAQGRGGRIIGASSVLGKNGHSALSSYCTSKFAVRGLTQCAALELGQHNITVNAYAPGLIETPMTAPFTGSLGGLPASDRDMIQVFLDNVRRAPIKGLGQPEDIAGLVSYLASKEAHFITGQCLSVDGGLAMS